MNHQKNIISGVVDYIENNIFENLSINTLSTISGYSIWHLQRLFKKHIGVNIGSYIRYRRLSKSAVLLKRSRISILEVAIATGFSSQQSYCRVFKNFFGVTPKKFRLERGWDFSKHLPPYRNSADLQFSYITSPLKLSLAKKNHVFYYHLTSEDSVIKRTQDRARKCRNGVRDFYYGTTDKYYSPPSKKPSTETFYSLAYFYFPEGKYLTITFQGTHDEYGAFLKELYDKHLPALNVRMKDEFIIELHPNKNSNELTLNTIILVPVLNAQVYYPTIYDN